MLLSQEVFSCVVANTPLISIDLLVQNDKGQVLLGKRVNEPACGFWFVPGGRIFKDESLDAAFSRTVNAELGLEMKRSEAAFDKTYEHFYENNVFNNAFSTHYIVLAHKIRVDCFVPRNDGMFVTASEARQSVCDSNDGKVDCFVPRNDAMLVTASETSVTASEARQSISCAKEQHSQYKWFEVEELLQDENVHNYTKDYFR